MQSIDRLMEVLDRLSQNEEGVRISTLRDELDLPVATLHRLLKGLAEHGLVYQDSETKHYRLGFRLLRLADRVHWPQALKSSLFPYLVQLRDQFRETVFLAVYVGGEVVCLDRVEGTNRVHYFAEVGAHLPMHVSSAGKAVAAHLPFAQVQRSLRNGLTAYTPVSITDVKEFQAHLAGVRAQGYALCVGEMEPGVWSVAAPVYESSGSVIGSLCLLGSEAHFDPETQRTAIEAVRSAAIAATVRLRGITAEGE